jgi:hypothetical protein
MVECEMLGKTFPVEEFSSLPFYRLQGSSTMKR